MTGARWHAVAAALATTLAAAAVAIPARATEAGLEDDGHAVWRLEQPKPPPAPAGTPSSETPIGLGRIGDIEFWAPNRGLLITAGNGSTIPAGVWVYDGVGWHELSTVCGASDGRIAWAGPDDFWTISDGRPGQAANPANGEPAPLANLTLCHFSGGQVVGSYASPAFQASSYQEMHAAGCLSASDCWFAGDPLPEPQVGAFHLHWDGHSLTAEHNPQGHAVEDMRAFGRYLYESVRIAPGDQLSEPEPSSPPVLRRIAPSGIQPTFIPLSTRLPQYAPGEFPAALDFLRLGVDTEGLWAAGGPAAQPPEGSAPAEVTVIHYAGGLWSQVVGPSTDPPGGNPFAEDVVSSIAAEPGGQNAWIALDSVRDAAAPSPLASALVARIAADGTISDEQRLPASGEGTGPRGAAEKIVCPAPHDCWMATTKGWLFHLSDGSKLAQDTDPAFAGPIGFRPTDEGLPQVAPDAPPADDSGLVEPPPPSTSVLVESPEAGAQSRVTVPLFSHLRTRLARGATLELRFHLAVKARVRLVAKRHRTVVARTRLSTFAAGNRRLLLRLDPRRWPTKLDLQSHALAPLPTVAGGGEAGGNSLVISGLSFLAAREHEALERPW